MFQDMMDTIGFVEKYDPEVGKALESELGRQRRNLELIASENIVSPAVLAATNESANYRHIFLKYPLTSAFEMRYNFNCEV